MRLIRKNKDRFEDWRQVLKAFNEEVLDRHPEANAFPQFVLDHWLLEWLFEEVKK